MKASSPNNGLMSGSGRAFAFAWGWWEYFMFIHSMQRWAPVPIRLIVGYGFYAHGVAKLGKGPENFVEIVNAIGVPFPEPMAYLTIWLEVICGILMIAGALVPLIAVPMMAILAVALFTVHIQFGFTSIKLMAVTAAGPQFGPPGIETDLLYMACLVTLVLSGPGPFAIDNWLRSSGPRSSRGSIGRRTVR